MDTQQNARQSFALGLAARKQRDEAQLMGLRVQATMLASQARIHALENANQAASLRLQAQQDQMTLAQERFGLLQSGAALKATDQKDFLQRMGQISPEDRSAIHSMNPGWFDFGPKGGPSSDQWMALYDAEGRARSKMTGGLGPSKVVVGPGGVTQTFESPDSNYHLNAFGVLQKKRDEAFATGDTQTANELQGRIDKLSGVKDLNPAEKAQADLAKARINRLEKAITDNPLSANPSPTSLARHTDLLRQANAARADLDHIMSRGATSAAPVAAPAGVPLELPKTESALVKGGTYSTARGTALWDGQKFIPVPAPAPEVPVPDHPADEP